MESKYEFYFSNRLSSNMPSASDGFFISNIDYLLMDHRSKKFILIELKTLGNEMSAMQRDMYNMLHKRFIVSNGTDGYEYIGTYLISFRGTNFYDGFVSIKGKQLNKSRLTEEELQKILTDLLS